MNKIFIILISTLIMQGCVGGMAFHESSQIQRGNSLSLAEIPFCKKQQKCFSSSVPKNKSDILSSCGEPSSVNINGRSETWTYQGPIGWSGIMPIVIIPIPLLVPTGHRDSVLEFSDDQLISIENQDTSESIAICGLIMLHTVGFGCFVD